MTALFQEILNILLPVLVGAGGVEIIRYFTTKNKATADAMKARAETNEIDDRSMRDNYGSIIDNLRAEIVMLKTQMTEQTASFKEKFQNQDNKIEEQALQLRQQDRINREQAEENMHLRKEISAVTAKYVNSQQVADLEISRLTRDIVVKDELLSDFYRVGVQHLLLIEHIGTASREKDPFDLQHAAQFTRDLLAMYQQPRSLRSDVIEFRKKGDANA